jgi:hypothetical protein
MIECIQFSGNANDAPGPVDSSPNLTPRPGKGKKVKTCMYS